MNRSRQLLAFFGHHKCGSTWINSIVADACRELKLRHATVYDAKTVDYDLHTFVEERRVDFIGYNNANYEYVKQLDNFMGIHVIRDPRDVIVSAYYSHLYSHPTAAWPELIVHRTKLQRLCKEDGILLEMDFNEQHLKDMHNWDYSLPNILEMKMEEIITSPYQYFIRIFGFLQILDEDHYSGRKRIFHLLCTVLRRIEWMSRERVSFGMSIKRLPAERILGIVWENDFAKKADGRERGREDARSHYRKGVSGDWRNHFNQNHIDVFKERYNHIVIGLGYEQDANWV